MLQHYKPQPNALLQLQISMMSAINLIKEAAEAGVDIAEVYVDTVGPAEKYQARLQEIFPHYKITVS